MTLNVNVIFQFWRHYKKLHLVCEIRISDMITWLTVIICQRASFNFIPCLEAEISRRHNCLSPYGTTLSAAVNFTADILFNSGMNIHVCPQLFAFNLKSKFLYLFAEKIELTKYLKISLQKQFFYENLGLVKQLRLN